MSEMTVKEKAESFWDSTKVRALGLLGAGSTLVVAASAEVDLNGTIEPILTDMTELIPSIIDLIVAIVPAIIVMAVVGFVDLTRSSISPVSRRLGIC